MRSRPRTLRRLVIGALAVIGCFFGSTYLFGRTGSVLSSVALFVLVGAALSALWGMRTAVLFVLPLTALAITSLVFSLQPVQPAFYSAAAQVGPVLLLVLGLEQRSLRQEARSTFEIVLFLVLFLYVAAAIVTALYGSAVCSDSSTTGCRNTLLRLEVGQVAVLFTAAGVTAAGLAGGLVAAIGLAGLSGSPQSSSSNWASLPSEGSSKCVIQGSGSPIFRGACHLAFAAIIVVASRRRL